MASPHATSTAGTCLGRPMRHHNRRGLPWQAHHYHRIIRQGNTALRQPKRPYSHRRSIRLRGYDYRQSGVYFVTICAYQQRKLFGSVVDGTVALTPAGEVARDEWRRIAQARANVELDHYVVMPNHVHGLLIISERTEPNIDQRKDFLLKQSRGVPAGSLGAIINHYKAAVSRRIRSNQLDCKTQIWQRNYCDHIVRHEAALNEIRKYIAENPARWHDDSLYVV